MTITSSLGIRNNNPGNIRTTSDRWQGLAQKQEGPFFVFTAAQWGIRAIARLLIVYQDKYDCHTAIDFIHRWAPPTENNTEAYVTDVCNRAGFTTYQELDVHTYDHCRRMVEAIIWHENGQQPYPSATIDKALLLAGVEPPKKPLVAVNQIRGSAIASAGIAASAITQVEAVKTQIFPLLDYADWLKPAFVCLSLLGIGLTVFETLRQRKQGVI